MICRAHLGAVVLAAGAMPLLSGCVAAAIPVLAAGGVLGTQIDGKNPSRPAGPPRVSIDLSEPAGADGSAGSPATVVRSATLADGTKVQVMAGPLQQDPATVAMGARPAGDASVPRNGSSAPPTSYTLDDGTRVQVFAGPMPPPSGSTESTGPARYDGFYGYALEQGTRPIVGAERSSALLASPGTLAPATRSCSIHPAAVLVDLDPGAAVLDPATVQSADPKFAGTLAALRAQGVTIGWLSANTPDRAGAIRRALTATGLDPMGRDELVLLRYPEERKQSRREEFGRQFCVVAIAGDERSDFDELFQYLKDPAKAAPLEPLMGKGWFLIPQPLS